MESYSDNSGQVVKTIQLLAAINITIGALSWIKAQSPSDFVFQMIFFSVINSLTKLLLKIMLGAIDFWSLIISKRKLSYRQLLSITL